MLKKDFCEHIDAYRFNDAAQSIYTFVWHEFCDWYLELIKPELQSDDAQIRGVARSCLRQVLAETLMVAHPVIPFVTQEIWNALPLLDMEDLALRPYPEARPQCLDPEAEAQMALVQGVITAVRTIRAELGIAPAAWLSVLVRAEGADAALVQAQRRAIQTLARVRDVTVDAAVTPPKACASAVVGGVEVFVPLSGVVDFAAEIARLTKELTKLEKELAAVTKKLANAAFRANAPAEVVAKEEAKAAEWGAKREALLAMRQRLETFAQEEG
jgi:valyl-tRNA synthetase